MARPTPSGHPSNGAQTQRSSALILHPPLEIPGSPLDQQTETMPRKFNVSIISRRRLLALPEVFEQAGAAFFVHKPTGLILRTSKECEIVLPWFILGTGKRVRTPELETLHAMWEPAYAALVKQQGNVVFVPAEENLMSIVEVVPLLVCSSCGRRATTEEKLEEHNPCGGGEPEVCLGFAIYRDKDTESKRFVALSPGDVTVAWLTIKKGKDWLPECERMSKVPAKAVLLKQDTKTRNFKIADESKLAMKKTLMKTHNTKAKIMKSKKLLQTSGVSMPKSPRIHSRKSSYGDLNGPSSPETSKTTRSSSLSTTIPLMTPPKKAYNAQYPQHLEYLDQDSWIVKMDIGASTRLDHLENAASRLSLLDHVFEETWSKITGCKDWLYLSQIILSGMQGSLNALCQVNGGYECRLGMSWIEVIETRKKISFKVELRSIVDEYETGWYAKVIVDTLKKESFNGSAPPMEEDHSVNFESRQLDFSDLCQFMTTQTAFVTSLTRCCSEYAGRLTKDAVIKASWNATRLPVDTEMATRLTKFGVAKHLGYL